MTLKPKFIAFGDSLTYGYPFGNNYSWVTLCEQSLGTTILNHGRNGLTLLEMQMRLNEDVIDLQPQYCLLTGGSNDFFGPYDVKKIIEKLIILLEKLKSHKIKTIVGLPPPILDKKIEKDCEKYRAAIKKYCKANKLITIDFYKALCNSKTKKPDKKLYEDTVHPNAQGYQQMAEAAAKELRKIG